LVTRASVPSGSVRSLSHANRTSAAFSGAPCEWLVARGVEEFGEFRDAAQQQIAMLDEWTHQFHAPRRAPQPCAQVRIDDPDAAGASEQGEACRLRLRPDQRGDARNQHRPRRADRDAVKVLRVDAAGGGLAAVIAHHAAIFQHDAGGAGFVAPDKPGVDPFGAEGVEDPVAGTVEAEPTDPGHL